MRRSITRLFILNNRLDWSVVICWFAQHRRSNELADNLITKRATIMTEKINTECEKCGIKFETMDELGRHMEDVHNEMQRKRIIRRQKPKKKR